MAKSITDKFKNINWPLAKYYTGVYAREGWTLILRNRFLSLFAGLTIFTLLTMGYVLIVLNSHLNQVLKQADSNLSVTVVIDKGTSETEIIPQVKALAGVTSVTFIPQAKTRDDFVKRTGLPPESAPKEDIFPKILVVKTKNADEIEPVAKKIKVLNGVRDTTYLSQLIQTITSTTQSLRQIALFTMIFLGLLAIGLLVAIVRVTVHAKRKNVKIMSLVGASRMTITLPLLVQIMIITFIAGTLACIVGWVVDPQLGVTNGSFLTGNNHELPNWLHTTRAYGFLALWPLIVPGFMLAAAAIVIYSVNKYLRD